MEKDAYFKRSQLAKVPNRCPILNYCMRRAYTIYMFSEFRKNGHGTDVIRALIKTGDIPEDFQERMIDVQGEGPTFTKSESLVYYQNMCPEVSLFDSEHSYPFTSGIATSAGEWDKYRTSQPFKNRENKHYSECSEYSKIAFEKKHNVKSRKNRAPISKQMRFEIYQRDKFTCQYCGRSPKDDDIKLHLDHKIPVASGGKDTFENLITSCDDCNSGKSNKII